MGHPGPLRRNLGPVAFVLALILAVSFLPPDTSLREVQRGGVLKACVPAAYPPLVTDDPDRPGVDVELLRAVAARLGVRLSLNRITAIGGDFNPRNWGLTRAHCAVIAGGVVDAPLTRSFLSMGPSYAETGWAAVAPGPMPAFGKGRVGVLTPVSGLDRVGLASFLRAEGIVPRILQGPEDLAEAIGTGQVALGVTEALLARQIAAAHGWEVEMLAPPLPRYPPGLRPLEGRSDAEAGGRARLSRPARGRHDDAHSRRLSR